MATIAELRKKKKDLNKLLNEAERLTGGKDTDAYRRHLDHMREEHLKQSKSARDIGEIPAVVRPEVRAACERDFEQFCVDYFPHTYQMAFSDDHRRVISKIVTAVLEGGQFAMAMPRASGKTSLAESACIWAVLYGHRRFVCLIGAEATSAEEMLASIRMELETNELLAGDFPECCYPIERLEGVNQRKLLYHGSLIRTRLSKTMVILPDIEGSVSRAAIIKVAGITGRIRGMKFKRPDGKSSRPDLVIIDDPQSDEAAHSPTQIAKRENLLAGAVLGLGGPGKKIAAVMPCTVIAPDDMADRILNKDLHPQWNGERTKLVYAFPEKDSEAEKLWAKYGDVRADGFRRGDGGRSGTEFYALHRAAMDAGFKIAWNERFNPDELSPIQHAMNLKQRDLQSFMAEYQNDPLHPQLSGECEILSKEQMANKLSSVPRGVVPRTCTRLTAFIDVQQKVLWYMVCAWAEGFSGYVIDFGAFPDQKQSYFTLQTAQRTLARTFPKAGLEGSIHQGLQGLAQQIIGREWMREDGSPMRIERCLIDANWGQSTNVVYDFCRRSTFAAVVMPSHGRGITASMLPMWEYKKVLGDRLGLNWWVPGATGKRALRKVIYDTNWWKAFVHSRLAVSIADPGSLSLWGRDPNEHRMLSEHWWAEFKVMTQGRGRTVEEFKIRPEHYDNHGLDCIAGCAVGASMQGITLASIEQSAAGKVKPFGAKKQKISLSALQGQRRTGR